MYRAKLVASPKKVKRQVGKYELGRTLGEGTFAKVRFARNVETGEHVAIKILEKEKIMKHKMVEQVCANFFVNFYCYQFNTGTGLVLAGTC